MFLQCRLDDLERFGSHAMKLCKVGAGRPGKFLERGVLGSMQGAGGRRSNPGRTSSDDVLVRTP
jgi:hypothetical protein